MTLPIEQELAACLEEENARLREGLVRAVAALEVIVDDVAPEVLVLVLDAIAEGKAALVASSSTAAAVPHADTPVAVFPHAATSPGGADSPTVTGAHTTDGHAQHPAVTAGPAADGLETVLGTAGPVHAGGEP